jgi:RNA polymerase sigma-70 factor (ECF subfamily)
MNDAAARISERFLVLRCQTGDEAALRELIERYSPGLRFFLRKMTAQSATADDLLQDTWFDVYRKVNSLRQPDAFPAWIYRIARDKAYREMRRRPSPDLSIDDHISQSIVHEEVQFTAEDAERVRAALDHLPLDQREVLILRFVEDLSYEQIAEVIARPIGTVRSRMNYAKQSLRAKLASPAFQKETPT